MKTLFIICVALAMAGCVSARRGDFSVRSLGDDIKGNVTWVKIDSNGCGEAFIFSGDKNASESTHTVANAACTIIGAFVGAGTPATPAGGAAIGLGVSEGWQTVKDWLRTKGGATTNQVTK